MNVCHDCYKMFNAGNEISPCCDCSSDLWLMERSSPASFCSKLILILLLKKNPSKRNCSVKKLNKKLNHGESCCLVDVLGTSPVAQAIGVIALVVTLCPGGTCTCIPEVKFLRAQEVCCPNAFKPRNSLADLFLAVSSPACHQ